MNFKATIIRPGLWGLTKKDLRDIGRSALEAVGFFWHANFKGFHFQNIAFTRYHYHTRTNAWEAKKRRLHPEAQGRPLVFTGESAQLAMANNKVRAKATAYDRYHADVIVSGPRLNFHANEMTRTTPEEDEAMQAEFASRFEAEMVLKAQASGVGERRLAEWRSRLAG